MKIIFWNVTGIENKDRENIKGLEGVGLDENMDGRENWEKIKKKLLKGVRWKVQGARRKNKKKERGKNDSGN